MRRAGLALLLVLCGCTFEEFALRNVPEGPSSSWRYGYADGCQSGRHDAGTKKQLDKDVARFRADDQYRDGWQSGYHDCLERAQNEANATATPTEAAAETPSPTPTLRPTQVPTPTFASAAERSAARRAEIETRLQELRREMKSLESELDTLPK